VAAGLRLRDGQLAFVDLLDCLVGVAGRLGFAAAGVGPDNGALPLRVWQLWEAMKAFVKAKDLIHFVAAAGVLAHYVGDASQPLHCSYLHHGIPPMLTVKGRKYPVQKDSAEFKDYKKTRDYKVHAIYEETMIDRHADSAVQRGSVSENDCGQAHH
jgi:hypothetical protein